MSASTNEERVVRTVAELKELVGQELGVGDWLEITQERVNQFADATGDHQYIHVDPERAAQTFFGGTIAHGYLTLSLLVPLLGEAFPKLDGYRLSLNYGLDRVRFPAPLPVGSRIRGCFVVQSVDEVSGGVQAKVLATIEREGQDKPVCVAEALYRYLV